MANTERSNADTTPKGFTRRPSSVASVESRRSSARTSLDSTRSFRAYSTFENTSTDRISHPRTSYDGQIDDRVFPVRSVVSVDPSQTPFQTPTCLRGESTSGFPGLSAVLVGSGPDGYKTARQDPARGAAVDPEGAPSAASVSRPSTADSEIQASVICAADRNRQKDAVSVLGSNEKSERGDQRRNGSYKVDPAKIFVTNDSSSSTSKASTLTSQANASHSAPPSITSHEHFPVTARFKHIVTDGGHAIITGRDGDALQRCEDERKQ